jgi:hypothetical protein
MVTAVVLIFFSMTAMNLLLIDGKAIMVSVNITSYLFLVTIRTFFVTQFMFGSCAIRIRFKALNDHLTKVALIQKAHPDLKSVQVSKYSVIYHKLCDGIDMFNETFTFQLVFTFGVAMVS